MDLVQLLADLTAVRCPVTRLAAPASAGVYAVFLRDAATLPGIRAGIDGLVYIGTSSNLAQRKFDTHFQSGKSGFSTLRRTLGALLVDDLALRPQPRGTGASDTNYRNYRFDDAGEHRLTDWMHTNLEVAVRPVAHPSDVETRLIGHARPPLNLTGWPNPDAPAIKSARRACVEAARSA